MPKNTPSPTPRKEKAQATRQNINSEGTGKQHQHKSIEEFESSVDLPGKTDSGPEPDVFPQEIPPQK